MASLFLGARGNLYGTAFRGGFFNREECSGGCGTLYKIDPAGNFSVLHHFKGGADGGHPLGSLIRSKDGKSLYGTTTGFFDQVYVGTVFRFGSTGETVLYGFPETYATGGGPSAGLTQDSAGNVYGTTIANGLINFGTVFKITP